MPGRKPGKSVKNPRQYEELRDQGMSKGQAAAISNASHKGRKGKAKGRGKG